MIQIAKQNAHQNRNIIIIHWLIITLRGRQKKMNRFFSSVKRLWQIHYSDQVFPHVFLFEKLEIKRNN